MDESLNMTANYNNDSTLNSGTPEVNNSAPQQPATQDPIQTGVQTQEPPKSTETQTPDVSSATQQEPAAQQNEQAKQEQSGVQATPDLIGNPEQQQDAQPTEYQDFYTAADNVAPEIGKNLNGSLSEIARANKWDQDTAKKNFDQMFGVMKQYQLSVIEQWKKETLADPEIGGANWKRTQALANKAFNEFLTESERRVVMENGAHNQKDIVRLLARIGERLDISSAPAGLNNGRPVQTKERTLRDFYSNYNN